MLNKSFFALIFCLTANLWAQGILTGIVAEKDDAGKLKPLIGVNLYWLGTSNGTTSDENGEFSIPLNSHSNELVASMTGYRSDTLRISSSQKVEVILTTEAHRLNDVVVTGKTQSTFSDYLDVENKSVITEQELCKAACCNLSESFETNPSVDVSFTDAITGAKQIEMLGLSGIYTQTTMENLPYIRGLMATSGLAFIPGTWVKAINMSKGIGSVANGFESITGQIDVDIQKPIEENSETLFLNLYGDYDRRFEGNLNLRYSPLKEASSITLIHASNRKHSLDANNDQFSDMPDFSIYNIMQRWSLAFSDRWTGQFGFQYLNDKKKGGTTGSHTEVPTLNAAVPESYKYSINSRQFNLYGKIGYVFPEEEYKSFGLQWSFNNYNNGSEFGHRNYSGDEKTGYINFIYQSALGSKEHQYRTGLSFLFDQFNERFLLNTYSRIERVPGAFLEYTYTPNETYSMNLGVRTDYHNLYGAMLTPRLHMRYSPQEDWVFRFAAGRGFRSSNIFTEFASVLASSRKVNILQSVNSGYGLEQEEAWNFGFNVMHYFFFDYREATISLDAYRTMFEQVTIGDLDTDPKQIIFSSVRNGSYSNSIQLELNMKPLERFDLRAAYRYMDVKQDIGGRRLDRPLSSKNRALLNLAYSSETQNEEEAQMLYDLTVQWFGKKRLPSTLVNPAGLQMPEYSPDFAVINAQITRAFNSGFAVYLGIENLLGFTQNDLMIDPLNPHGEYFDASLIWGPVKGRMVYAGLRLKM